MVVVLVLAQKSVIGTYIAFQPGVIRPCAVNHDALNGNLATRPVTGVFGKKQFMQIHYHCLLCYEVVPEFLSAFQAQGVRDERCSPAGIHPR